MTFSDGLLIFIASAFAWLHGQWVERQYPRDTPWGVYLVSELCDIGWWIVRLIVGLMVRIARAVVDAWLVSIVLPR